MGLLGALVLGACSSNSSNPVDAAPMDVAPDLGPPLVTISGTAAPHLLAAALEAPTPTDFSQLVVAVVDPTIVLANPAAPPLKGGPLDTSAGNCGAAGCAWSFDNVDISTISLGLVGILDDTRTPAASRLWLKTGTGAGAIDLINMVKMSRQPLTDRRLFAVSKVMEGKLAAFSALAIPDTTIAPGVLETRGFMIGTVVGKLSAGPSPVPVAGAVITTSDTRITILYPSADFMSNGTSTANHGTFLVVPKPATPQTSVVAGWSVTPPAGDGRTWPSLMAGTTPGTCFVILFAANETP
jgi:hypothetical protein